MSRACPELSRFVRKTLLCSSALALSSMIFLSTAQAQSHEFHVPGGDLKEALAAYVRQAGVQLLYREDDVRGLTTAGVRGTLSVEEALSRLLKGTSLTVQRESSGAIAIGRLAPARKDDDTARAPGKFATTGMRLAQADTPRAQGSTSASASDGSTAEEQAADARSAVVLDEVLVTGTHIRGTDNLTVPLIVMDREFINSTGLTTTVQLIESLPQNFALVNQSVTGGGLSGNSYATVQGSTINLRGVGEGTTLTLINGRRVPLGYDGSAVNIAALPMSAIERVEVVTDGASALYGSDAVGGVVNFVLRKDFDGAETRVRSGVADAVDELRASQTFGYGWNSGNIVVSGEYYQRDMLLGTDRDFGIGPNTTIGSLLPEEKNVAATLFGRQNITDNLEMFVEALYTNRDSENRASHATPATNRSNFIDNTQLSATAGMALDFGSDWRAELSGGYGKDDIETDFLDPPATLSHSGSIPVQFELTGAELKADGPLFDLPGGAVRLAIGAQWRDETQLSRNVFRNSAGATTTNVRFERDRQVNSFYTEAAVPLVGPDNALTGLQRLDLSLAARYDDYSDFGSSTDPRIGLAWKPTQALTLRGSWGTSYLAPKLREFDVAFNSATAISDYPGANFLHVLVVNGNAPDIIGPQESENFTIGLDWAPEFLPGARFAVNYYDIEYSDRIDSIGSVTPETIIANPSAFTGVAIFDPTEAQVLEYIAYGTAGGRPFLAFNPNFTPNLNFQPGDVDFIYDGRRLNIGVVKTSGFDVSASYDFAAFGGRMHVALDGARIDELTKQITETTTPIEMLDTFSQPTQWRARAHVGFRSGGWAANAFVHHRNSYTDNRFMPFFEVDDNTTVDASVGYTFGSASGALSNTTITFGAINVLDEDPPPTRVRPTTGVFDLGFDPANASPLGRLLTLDLTKRW